MRVEDAIFEGGDGDLNIDHIFGRQARHGRRADVINTQGQIAEPLAQAGGDSLKV